MCFPPLCGEGARYTVSEDCFLLSELGVTVAAPTVARLSRTWRDKRRTICQGQMIAKGTDVYLSKIRGGSVSMLFVSILTFGTM